MNSSISLFQFKYLFFFIFKVFYPRHTETIQNTTAEWGESGFHSCRLKSEGRWGSHISVHMHGNVATYSSALSCSLSCLSEMLQLFHFPHLQKHLAILILLIHGFESNILSGAIYFTATTYNRTCTPSRSLWSGFEITVIFLYRYISH